MMMNNNMNNQMMMNNNMNNQMIMNNSNNQMMMNNNINQNGNDKMKELLEELDYMRNKVNLYEKRIKTLEERIKEKDSEIINLKNMLSSNFYYNQGMQPFNYNHYPMMMGQMNNFMNNSNQAINSNNMKKENSSKNIIINFIFDGNKIEVQGNSNMTIEKLIKNFRAKLGIDNFSGDYFFKGKKIDKDSAQTLKECGIYNESDIYVFDQNDKNQKEKISRILSYKHDNITITFNASTGHKTIITARFYIKISKILKLYCKKIGFSKALIGKDIWFLHNEKQIGIDDNRTIEELSGGKDSFIIIVYDLEGIIGA